MRTVSSDYNTLAEKLAAVGQHYTDEHPRSNYAVVRLFQSSTSRAVATSLTNPHNDGLPAETRLVRAMKQLATGGSDKLRMLILQAVGEQREHDRAINGSPAMSFEDELTRNYPTPNPGFPKGSAAAIERLYDTTHGVALTATTR